MPSQQQQLPGVNHTSPTPDGSLLARFGSAKHPEREVARRRGPEVDDATVEALGKLSEAFEVVENARGLLYEFHRKSGMADLAL